MSYKSKDSDHWSRASEALLRASKDQHAPSAAVRARVRSALARTIAATPSAPATASDATASDAPTLAPTGSSQVARSNLFKVGLGVALVITGAFVYMRAGQSAIRGADSPARETPRLASPRIEQHPLAAPTTTAREAIASPEAARQNTWQSRGQRRARELRPGALAPAPTASRSTPARTTRAARDREARAPANESTPEVLSASETPRSSESAPASQQSSTEQAARVDIAPSVSARVPPAELPSEARAADDSGARAELVFLRRIQGAMLDSDPAMVLALCAEHERRWPRGTFVPEREGLRALASCEADATDAKARASTFVTRYPRSPLAPRVRAACAPLLVPQRPTVPASPR